MFKADLAEYAVQQLPPPKQQSAPGYAKFRRGSSWPYGGLL